MENESGGENEQSNFNNPHCALLSNPDLLANQTVLCGMSDRVPPRFPFMLSVFSNGKTDLSHLRSRSKPEAHIRVEQCKTMLRCSSSFVIVNHR